MNQTTTAHVRGKVQHLQSALKQINTEITNNSKQFDDMMLENKQTYAAIDRNLDDSKNIFEKDLYKFEEIVDKSILQNQAMYVRTQKDVNYLHSDQQALKNKMQLLNNKLQEMHAQIGNDKIH